MYKNVEAEKSRPKNTRRKIPAKKSWPKNPGRKIYGELHLN